MCDVCGEKCVICVMCVVRMMCDTCMCCSHPCSYAVVVQDSIFYATLNTTIIPEGKELTAKVCHNWLSPS